MTIRARITLYAEETVEVIKEVNETTYFALRAIARELNEQKVPYQAEMKVEELARHGTICHVHLAQDCHEGCPYRS